MSKQTNFNTEPPDFEYKHTPETNQSFERALERARSGIRLSIADGIELLTTGTDFSAIDPERKRAVIKAADERRRETAGDTVTFVANLNNNITTACDIGCKFCNYRTPQSSHLSSTSESPSAFTQTPDESSKLVDSALDRGVSEITTVSGLHPALVLNEDHRQQLSSSANNDYLRYTPPEKYEKNPGTYAEQISSMSIDGVHIHGITPEEADHARRGTDWDYTMVYRELKKAGLNSVPGTAAEILVDEVRDILCPNKISADEWMQAMKAAASVGLDITATIMYGHIENEAHRIMHLNQIRDLQDQTNSITEFIPLSFTHQNTPLYEQGYVSSGPTKAEEELMTAVSRLFLDNIRNIQSSWVKHGNSRGLRLLQCGANDFMGTCLSEEITARAGGDNGQYRSFNDYVPLIRSIDRKPAERSADYSQQRIIDSSTMPYGPQIGPRADGTPMF